MAITMHTGVGNTRVQIKDYANGIQVRFIPSTDDETGARGWMYEVWSGNGAEMEDWGWSPSKAEATEWARDARISLSYQR